MTSVLNDKVALVTGAARGIGAAVAYRLANDGATVYLADIISCSDAVSTITDAGGRASGHALDIRDANAVQSLTQQIVDTHGQLDILVCNAGVCPPGEVAGDWAQWQSVMDVNVNGTRHCIAAAWPVMESQEHGRIVLVSSMAFYRGGLIVGTEYSTSKAALIGMTRHLARNGGPLGILCNAVAPGIIDTEMTRGFDKPDLDAIPLGRYGTADEVAAPIHFLCTSGADYMTGTVLNITGGMVLAD